MKLMAAENCYKIGLEFLEIFFSSHLLSENFIVYVHCVKVTFKYIKITWDSYKVLILEYVMFTGLRNSYYCQLKL